MNVTITPGQLCGIITPPPSKSESHRYIIGASLCEGVSVIENIAYSEDIAATLRCMQALGAEFVQAENRLTVTGLFRDGKAPQVAALPQLDCGESGSTLRFLLPIALAVAGGGVFSGRGRLMARPQKPYADLFARKGIFYEQTADTITVRGRLAAGTYDLPGNVSSQFFTGLLYALPLLDAPSRVVSTTKLESWSYIAMTLSAQAAFAVCGHETQNAAGDWDDFHVFAPASYRCARQIIGADWSNGAFWYAANALGGRLELRGLDKNSPQGDRVIADFAQQLAGGGAVTLDVSDCPDLVPPLAVIAALREGQTTHIVGAGRLRMKESDRLATVTDTLCALGADMDQHPDSLTIRGVRTLRGGCVDGCNDHRIAMMAAIAATRADGPVTITGAQCVNKSYPDFWTHFAALGGLIT